MVKYTYRYGKLWKILDTYCEYRTAWDCIAVLEEVLPYRSDRKPEKYWDKVWRQDFEKQILIGNLNILRLLYA